MQGLDLAPLAGRHPEPARLAVSNLDGGGVAAIRVGRWKLIGSHLFDLARDPGENIDVSSRYVEVAAYLEARRRALLAARPASSGPLFCAGRGASAELRALGYLAGPLAADGGPSAP
jgi:hypothetical protein